MIPKFRAWLKKEKKMIEPNDILNISFKLGEVVPDFNFKFDKEDYSFFDLELMQSTGLFDKNGKEIFDGDILKVKIMSGQSWLETVRYNDEKAMFVSKEVKRKVLESPLYDLFITDLFEVEVIGNIYENPELVEVEI